MVRPVALALRSTLHLQWAQSSHMRVQRNLISKYGLLQENGGQFMFSVNWLISLPCSLPATGERQGTQRAVPVRPSTPVRLGAPVSSSIEMHFSAAAPHLDIIIQLGANAIGCFQADGDQADFYPSGTLG